MSQWLKIYNIRKILSPSSTHPLVAKTNATCSAVSLIAEHLVYSTNRWLHSKVTNL